MGVALEGKDAYMCLGVFDLFEAVGDHRLATLHRLPGLGQLQDGESLSAWLGSATELMRFYLLGQRLLVVFEGGVASFGSLKRVLCQLQSLEQVLVRAVVAKGQVLPQMPPDERQNR